MSIYFTSDHHFGEAAARSFYRRPFASLDAMDQQMISRWNAAVSPDDEVWYLGDFARRRLSLERAADLLSVLNGRKHLIVGNNDDAGVTECSGWRTVQAYAELTVDGRKLILCHYPFRTWRDMSRGSINLHGHSHGRLRELPRQFDVGVDVRAFRPVRLADLLDAG